jgi:hypothetical protein
VGTSVDSSVKLDHAQSRKPIRLSETAEAYLDQLGVDLALGTVEYMQLPPSLKQFYWFAWLDGNANSTSPRIRKLDQECDRLYDLAFGDRPLYDANQKSFADLERIRGHHDSAERYEAFLADLLDGSGVIA